MCLKLLRHINDNSIRNNSSIRKNNYVTSVPYLCQNLFLSKLTLEKYSIYGGERGIRTLDSVATIHAFQAGAFNLGLEFIREN